MYLLGMSYKKYPEHAENLTYVDARRLARFNTNLSITSGDVQKHLLVLDNADYF